MISAALESTFQRISPHVPLINKRDQDRMKLQNNQTKTGVKQKRIWQFLDSLTTYMGAT